MRTLNQRLHHFQEQSRRQASLRKRNLARSHKKQGRRQRKEWQGQRGVDALSDTNRQLLEEVERRFSDWGLRSCDNGGGGGKGVGAEVVGTRHTRSSRHGQSQMRAAQTEIEHVPLVKDLLELSIFCDKMRNKLIAKCAPVWIPGESQHQEGRDGASKGVAGTKVRETKEEDREHELEEARESAEKTAAALRAAMKQVRNGLFRFGLEAGVFSEGDEQM